MDGVATLTHSLRSEQAMDQMVSVALASYLSGSKVRAYSKDSTCEADFISIQDTYF